MTDYPVASLVIIVSAVLVSSCGQTRTITDKNHTHTETDMHDVFAGSELQCTSLLINGRKLVPYRSVKSLL